MNFLLSFLYFFCAPAFADTPPAPTDIYKMRREIQNTAQIIGKSGVNQAGKRCYLTTFIDRTKPVHSLGLTFNREDGSTIYLFYPHQDLRMKKSNLERGGTRTDFFKGKKLFLILESLPRVKESAHIEAGGGHSQDCGRYYN